MPDDQTSEQPAQERWRVHNINYPTLALYWTRDTQPDKRYYLSELVGVFNALEARAEADRQELEAWKRQAQELEAHADDYSQQNIGAAITAQMLLEIRETGQHKGTFGGEDIEKVAQAILADRQRIAELERETDAQDVVIQGLKREWRAAEARIAELEEERDTFIRQAHSWAQSMAGLAQRDIGRLQHDAIFVRAQLTSLAERIKQDTAEGYEYWRRTIGRYKERAEAAEAEREALRARAELALTWLNGRDQRTHFVARHSGFHDQLCKRYIDGLAFTGPNDCDCGLQAVLDALTTPAASQEEGA